MLLFIKKVPCVGAVVTKYTSVAPSVSVPETTRSTACPSFTDLDVVATTVGGSFTGLTFIVTVAGELAVPLLSLTVNVNESEVLSAPLCLYTNDPSFWIVTVPFFGVAETVNSFALSPES